jgi:predicted DNA repair protein MutK
MASKDGPGWIQAVCAVAVLVASGALGAVGVHVRLHAVEIKQEETDQHIERMELSDEAVARSLGDIKVMLGRLDERLKAIQGPLVLGPTD